MFTNIINTVISFSPQQILKAIATKTSIQKQIKGETDAYLSHSEQIQMFPYSRLL